MTLKPHRHAIGDAVRSTWPLALAAAVVGFWVWHRFAREVPEHPHRATGRGGVIVALGQNRHHVELVLGVDRALTLYTLGADERDLHDIPIQSIPAEVFGTDATAVDVRFEPWPQTGDPPRRTSRFRAEIPASLTCRPMAVAALLTIDGNRYRPRFTLPHVEPAMPIAATGDSERELYLIPAGRYTRADIAANGSVVPSKRFQGFQARHDVNPSPGDPLCPITRTKAHPACSWVIDGRTYLFCCPPCIDEFVRLAKRSEVPMPPPERQP